MRYSPIKSATIVILFLCMAFLGGQSLAAESSQIVEGSKVTFLYEITVAGSTEITARDVGLFIQGQHQILPALEREVAGMKPGEKKKVILDVGEGFGPYDAEKRKTIPKAQLPVGVKEGDILEDRTGHPATVAELSDSSAVLDYNHPLAGKPLIVEVRILKVENSS